MLIKIPISNNLINQYKNNPEINPKINTYSKYLILKAIKELRAKGSEKWIRMCYRKNTKIAETAKVIALEIPEENIRNCRAAIFTAIFKRLLRN